MNKFMLMLIAGTCLFGVHCKSDNSQQPEFKKILVVGNSITLVNRNAIWLGNWGMAASQKSRDFVNIIAARLNAEVRPINISVWETNHRSYQLSNFDKHFDQNHDLVIIRIGENIQDLNGFELSLTELVSYIKKKDPNAIIMVTGTFWRLPEVNTILNNFALKNGLPFVPLSQLDTKENRSFIGASLQAEDGSVYKVSNQGVADHPGDAGMEAIAEAILKAIKK